jgi:hypothetical protein
MDLLEEAGTYTMSHLLNLVAVTAYVLPLLLPPPPLGVLGSDALSKLRM